MNILYPIEWVVTWIMVQFHALLSLFMAADSGWTWLLSIVGLTVVIRIVLIPLFVKQIRASRAMQLVAPELQAIQKKYKGKTDQESRQKLAQETMAVYKEGGANPFSSCLPILLQMPIFFALFRVLYYKIPEASEQNTAFGPLTPHLADSAHTGTLFGEVTVASNFLNGPGGWEAKIFAAIVIVLMIAVTFITQKELTMRNLPPSALEGPMANTQKMMLYMLPFIYVISGPGMPLGVLIYWLTTNTWNLGQQWIIIRNSPTPGSAAEKAHQERINAKRARKGLEPLDFTPKKKPVPVEEQQIRVQPRAAKGGKKLSDEERLAAAREARAKAQSERRAAQGPETTEKKPTSKSKRSQRKGSGSH